MTHRITLYFGSFNPIHRGHLAVAERVVESGLCDELWYIISPHNPHKVCVDLADEQQRLLMARMAVAESRYSRKLRVSDVEFSLPRPSYTIDTLDHLCKEYPDTEFSILMGGDNAAKIETWKEWERLLSSYKIIVYPRRGEVVDERFTLLSGVPLLDISSTAIREAVADQKPIDKFVTPAIASYIEAHPELWSRVEVLRARGKRRFAESNFGGAINDFVAVSRLCGGDEEADQMANMAREILDFRYKDIYNP
ncbi:MAG: nicotinate (nicotinamide) nucleotide adenylyltransferase [Tidjanibacter sp.]|nr:nicotinate (nicotinamide) nucleotide adenylyltransferase [Tidjanibacter sp.]